MSEQSVSPKKDERDYEAESAYDTLVRAEEIKANEKMMERVRKCAEGKMEAVLKIAPQIKKISDLKKVYAKKVKEDNERD